MRILLSAGPRTSAPLPFDYPEVVSRDLLGICLRLIGHRRYFGIDAHCKGGAEAEQEGGEGQEARKKRYPLIEDPYPHPHFETRDSLAVRAQLSASALITLNEQVRHGILMAFWMREDPSKLTNLVAFCWFSGGLNSCHAA